MVLVEDHAGVSGDILEHAREVAKQLYRDIEVDIVWLEHGDPRLQDAAVLKSLIIVHVLTREMADSMRTPSGLLGMAVSGSRFAKVFYARIEDVSPTRNGPDTSCLLGHVLAHEMGHLLLPPSTHSKLGIMQAGLNPQLVAQGALRFTASQSQLIRARLSRVSPTN
jgi:hypothetical protein